MLLFFTLTVPPSLYTPILFLVKSQLSIVALELPDTTIPRVLATNSQLAIKGGSTVVDQ